MLPDFRVPVKSSTALLLIALISGCGDSTTREQSVREIELRKQLLSESDLGPTKSVEVARRAFSEGEQQPIDVVLLGRIDAGDLPPWEAGQAAFILTDATGHEGEADHDPHECPFCSRNINNYLVKVTFQDDQGQPIGVDTRDLFGVKEKQLIKVSGQAVIDADDDLLALNASRLQVVDLSTLRPTGTGGSKTGDDAAEDDSASVDQSDEQPTEFSDGKS